MGHSRDIKERLMYRGILVSHETICLWCLKFGPHFFGVIKKREAKPSDSRWLEYELQNDSSACL